MIEYHFPSLADITLFQMDLEMSFSKETLLDVDASSVIEANIAESLIKIPELKFMCIV
jgi:hypothetical protein